MAHFADALQLAATVRNLGARDAGLLRCVDVVAFAGREIELLGRCLPYDDGRHRAVIRPDAARHRAIALRLHFADGRARLCPATSLCACRCHGLCVVHFDAMSATTRWCFGPDDDQATVPDEQMLEDWREQAHVAPRVAPELAEPEERPVSPKAGRDPDWGALLGTNNDRPTSSGRGASGPAPRSEEAPAKPRVEQTETIAKNMRDKPSPSMVTLTNGSERGEEARSSTMTERDVSAAPRPVPRSQEAPAALRPAPAPAIVATIRQEPSLAATTLTNGSSRVEPSRPPPTSTNSGPRVEPVRAATTPERAAVATPTQGRVEQRSIATPSPVRELAARPVNVVGARR
ncbi:MAG: hypothetical protein H6747_13995 [Deltaproteobacteria bacterium]|nr:hypothetical protein [Deltaproteobacteria bacterium]